MGKNVLLLGRTGIVLEDVEGDLDVQGVRLLAGTSLADVQQVLADNAVDVVIMGAGLDLATRLAIVEEIFQTATTQAFT